MDALRGDTSPWWRSPWLHEPIDGRVAAGLGVTWLVLTQIAYALEPSTNQPEPFYGIALELAMWSLLAVMVVGLVMQRRFGLVASLAAATFLTALSIACPVSGHHPFGTWWYGQMACVLALVAASVIALRWQAPVPEPAAPPTDLELVDRESEHQH